VPGEALARDLPEGTLELAELSRRANVRVLHTAQGLADLAEVAEMIIVIPTHVISLFSTQWALFRFLAVGTMCLRSYLSHRRPRVLDFHPRRLAHR
jgi:hypothetical protein